MDRSRYGADQFFMVHDAGDAVAAGAAADRAACTVAQPGRDEAGCDADALLAAIVASSSDAILSTTLDGTVTTWNTSAERLLGYAAHEIIGASIRMLLPIGRDGEEDDILARISRGEMLRGFESERRRKDGTVVPVFITASPVRDAMGRIVGVSKILRDITERRASEARLLESDHRLRSLLDTTFHYIGLVDADGTIIELNRASLAALGAAAGEVAGCPFWELAWWRDRPEDQLRVREAMALAAAGETSRFEVSYCPVGGDERTVDFTISPMRGDDGSVVLLVPEGRDSTERRQAEAHARLLMAEVNHRAKNVLAVVNAIARRTVSSTPELFLARFAERVQALAASQDLLVRNDWRSIDLGDLVASQLAHFADLLGTRIRLDGPPVRINSEAAQSIGLALHELATNSGKYGALSCDGGRVELAWALSGDGFDLVWREVGGPPVRTPTRRGFGTTVIESMTRMKLGGSSTLSFPADGVRWTLACPASKVLHDPS